MNTKNKGDVYLFGTANSGKSLLFNRLLTSDYCRKLALIAIPEAMISRWPNTTISMLRFPIFRLSREAIRERQIRLKVEQNSHDRKLFHRMIKFKETKSTKYASLTGFLGSTFQNSYYERFNSENSRLNEDFSSHFGRELLSSSPKFFRKSKTEIYNCFYDTPGVITSSDVLRYLNNKKKSFLLKNFKKFVFYL